MKKYLFRWLVFFVGFSISSYANALRVEINNEPGFKSHLSPEKTMIYESNGQWNYSHHPDVVWFKGFFYVMWSSGLVGEDEPGQRVVLVRSSDFKRWSPPVLIVGGIDGFRRGEVITAVGFYLKGDVLSAYYASYREDERGRVTNVQTFVMTTKDGLVWSEPIELEISTVANHAPVHLPSGRLILLGHTVFPYSDDLTGLGGFRYAGIAPRSAGTVPDGNFSIRDVARSAGWGDVLCEGALIYFSDGRLRIFLRSESGRLWVTESTDNGVKWTAPEPTGFSNDNSKFAFGLLGDGRYWSVGNPVPGSLRNPLVFSVSHDGNSFNRWYVISDVPVRLKYPGRFKGGVYGYPAVLVKDGKVYVVCSVNKEDVQGFVFNIPPR